MPKKRNTRSKKSSKTGIITRSFSKSRIKFSRPKFLALVILFALVGGYFIFRSFAANVTTYNLRGAPVGIAASGTGGDGYWIGAADGGVFAQGTATFHGSLGATALAKPIVGIVSTADHGGYWMVAGDGGIFTYGNAGYYGSMGGKALSAPIVGMAATPDGGGYTLIASDGGIFNFGDSQYAGSIPGSDTGAGPLHLSAPVSGIASGPTDKGYWMLSQDGGVFTSDNVPFYGAAAGILKAGTKAVAITATPDHKGYWILASDGGVFTYGDAGFYGSMGGVTLDGPAVGLASTASGKGYWIVAGDGGVFTYGDATYQGRVVYNPPTANISASPTTITAGQSTTLSWSTTNTSQVSITNIGSVLPSASKAVSPTATTTYTLSAIGGGGNASVSVTITVNQPAGRAATTSPGAVAKQPATTASSTGCPAGYVDVGDCVPASSLPPNTTTCPSGDFFANLALGGCQHVAQSSGSSRTSTTAKKATSVPNTAASESAVNTLDQARGTNIVPTTPPSYFRDKPTRPTCGIDIDCS
jgi:hypothetical protein